MTLLKSHQAAACAAYINAQACRCPMGLFARSNEPCTDETTEVRWELAHKRISVASDVYGERRDSSCPKDTNLSAGRNEKPCTDRKDNTMLILDTEIREELKIVEKDLAEYLRAEGNASQVGDILRDVSLSGGKRLRPQLLLLAAQFGPFYEEKKERLCSLAALIEMVHAASLIHDDIVDDSPVRRGRPSIQSKYGKDRAVYAGDLVLSRIVKALFNGGFYQVGGLFGQAVEEMCIGELGQMQCLFDAEVPIERYFANVDGKTAALCRLACAAGAMESGASQETAEQLVLFGGNFGKMFQIHDDILDFVSDASLEGKPVRADFREGILTLPGLYAVKTEAAGKAIRELLAKALQGRFSDADSAELVRLVRESGGIEEAKRDLGRYAASANEALQGLPPCHARDVLAGLVAHMTRE